MTDHARTSYRNHRRATWGLVIAVVIAIAAALVPLATGAGAQKFYTVGVPPSLCSTPTRQTLTLTLSNQTRNQNLGSANLTAPDGIALVTGSGSVAGAGAATISVNVPDQFSTTANTIRLRNLVLPTNTSTATITVAADVTSGGTWATIGKQSNNFSDSGPGNLFAPSGGPFTTTVSQCQQNYVFVQRPVDAERGAAQTVKVQLQLGGQPVPVSDSLTLTALRNGNPVPATTPPVFSGLTASPDTSGAYAGKQWTFSVTGNVSNTGYALQAGSTISSPTFSIDDGLCPPDTTDTQHLTSTCSLTSDLNGGILESGVTINNHKLPGSIGIDFVASSDGAGKCDPWTRASYTAGGQTYYFPGVSLDFDTAAASGLLKVVYRVRNADWVLTDAARGNNDIEICAGARHGDPGRASWNAPNSDPSSVPFIGKNGPAQWDADDGLFWGVLASVANPSKVKNDPVVCGSGTQDLATGPNGAVEKWRTWTICIPFDWDWKNF